MDISSFTCTNNALSRMLPNQGPAQNYVNITYSHCSDHIGGHITIYRWWHHEDGKIKYVYAMPDIPVKNWTSIFEASASLSIQQKSLNC